MLRIDSRTVVHLHGLNSTIISGIAGQDRMGNLFMSNLQTGFPRLPGSVKSHYGTPSSRMDVGSKPTRSSVIWYSEYCTIWSQAYSGFTSRLTMDQLSFSAGSVNPDREEVGWEPAYNLIELTSAGSNEQRQVAIFARQFRWQSYPNGFVSKIDMVTGDPVFVHQVPVDGEDILPVDVQTAKEAGEIAMADREASLNDPPVLVGPDVRDIIYRFWELEPRDRRQVLNETGFRAGTECGGP